MCAIVPPVEMFGLSTSPAMCNALHRSLYITTAHALTACHVGRYSQPAAVLVRPHIRVATGACPPARQRIGSPGVNDRKIAHEPDLDVMGRQVRELDG